MDIDTFDVDLVSGTDFCRRFTAVDRLAATGSSTPARRALRRRHHRLGMFLGGLFRFRPAPGAGGTGHAAFSGRRFLDGRTVRSVFVHRGFRLKSFVAVWALFR